MILEKQTQSTPELSYSTQFPGLEPKPLTPNQEFDQPIDLSEDISQCPF